MRLSVSRVQFVLNRTKIAINGSYTAGFIPQIEMLIQHKDTGDQLAKKSGPKPNDLEKQARDKKILEHRQAARSSPLVFRSRHRDV